MNNVKLASLLENEILGGSKSSQRSRDLHGCVN